MLIVKVYRDLNLLNKAVMLKSITCKYSVGYWFAPINFLKVLSCCIIFCIFGCSGEIPEPLPTEERAVARERLERERRGESDESTLLGDLIGNIGGSSGNFQGPTIGVNAHLWKASLDTLSFMPLASADPFGGIIITEWYTSSDSPTEKFKIIVYITGMQLKVDALKIKVFKKIKNETGDWLDQPANLELSVKIENSVLTKAREYKIISTENK